MTQARWREFRTDLMSRINIEETYRSLGVEITGRSPDSQGFIQCKCPLALGQEDNTPSASINVLTGTFFDFRTGKGISFWDALVALGVAGTWRDAQKVMADRHGLKIPRKSKKDPDYKLEPVRFSDNLLQGFLLAKPPITAEGIKSSGGAIANWHGIPSLVWQVLDHTLSVVGYYIMRLDGEKFDNGAKAIAKTYEGMDAGFIGRSGMHQIVGHQTKEKCLSVIIAEGGTDMAAICSRGSGICCISGIHGAGHGTTESQKSLFRDKEVQIVLAFDADIPGVDGAFKKRRGLSEVVQPDRIRIYTPATEITPSRGMDMRDWLVEHPDIEIDRELEFTRHLVFQDPDKREREIRKKAQAREDEQAEEHDRRFMSHSRKLLADCKMVVLTDASGRIILDSQKTKKRKRFQSFNGITYEDIMAVGGPVFRSKVMPPQTDANGQATWNDFKQAVAAIASENADMSVKEVGDGLWLMGNDNLILVSGGRFIRIDDEIKVLGRSTYDGNMVDFECSEAWLDVDRLMDEYGQARTDMEYGTRIHRDLLSIISSWQWTDPRMAELVCGLIYATWAQTFLSFRPIISVAGESQSGKTTFFQAMEKLFLNTSRAPGKSSCAGVLQRYVRNRGTLLALDEFDKWDPRERNKMCDQLRGTSQNQESARGLQNAGSKGVTYSLRHIPWLAGIYTASDDDADINRAIELGLVKSKQRTIKKLHPTEMEKLGYRILATVLANAKKINSISEKIVTADTANSRYRDSYSIPYAAIAAVTGQEEEKAQEAFDQYLADIVTPTLDESSADQEKYLDEILGMRIKLKFEREGPDELTVAQIININNKENRNNIMYVGELEKHGLAVKIKRDGSGQKVFCIKSAALVRRHGGLEHLGMKAKALDQVLLRLDNLEARKERQLLGGKYSTCICLDWDLLLAWMGDPGNLPPEGKNLITLSQVPLFSGDSEK